MAAPIAITDLNFFRTVNSVNDVGILPGDNFQIGANIVGGSAGTSIAGMFTPTASTVPTFTQSFIRCSPLSVAPNFCARNFKFDPTRLDGTWQVQFERGSDLATFTLPSIPPIPLEPAPFPATVRIRGGGINPTIGWSFPPSFAPDALSVGIYDRSSPPPLGRTNDVIHAAKLPPHTVSYTIPTVLSSSTPSHTVSLIPGHKYSINFQIIETRDGGPIPTGGGNADILTRSSSFFDFTPPGPDAPEEIALPMVSAPDGVYHFSGTDVGPDFTTFIDPKAATGYIYDTASGDPNFASVSLPDVGDGKYALSFLDGDDLVSTGLDAGVQFFFPAGGVSEFKVTGIEASAGLDPRDTLAFITGLTFVTAGEFNGTMTPIVTDVAEPGPMGLLGVGIALFSFVGWVERSETHRRLRGRRCVGGPIAAEVVVGLDIRAS